MIWDYQLQLARRLLLWGILGLAAGIWLTISNSGIWLSFGLQALLWGLVEGIIALFWMRRSSKKVNSRVDMAEVEGEAVKLRRNLRINAALDLLYLTGGALLLCLRGQTDAFAAGSGWGIVVQGGFLLLFDLLHSLRVPQEYVIPDLGILEETEHHASTLEAGSPAVLLVHGFPGTPAEMSGFAEALHRQGWTVRLMRLPGHGSGYRFLLQTRAQDWERAVQEELAVLQVMHQPVLLVGYSLGAGLSIPVAAKCKPDGLVLLAPFWIDEPWWLKYLLFIVRPFLPVAVNPFKRMRLDIPQFHVAIADVIPGFDFNTPVIQAAMRTFRLPLVFIEQFRLFSRWVRKSAGKIVDMPVLVVQAREDTIALEKSTKKLIDWMPAEIVFCQVAGDHNLNQRTHPGYAEAEQVVLEFAGKFLERK